MAKRLLACEILEIVATEKEFDKRVEIVALYLTMDKEFKHLMDITYNKSYQFEKALANINATPVQRGDRAACAFSFREFLKEAKYIEDRYPMARERRKREKLEFCITNMHKDEAAIIMNALTHSDSFVTINELVVKAAYEKCGFDTSFFQ